MEKRILVTGASGHIGYHVASHLLCLGYKIVITFRTENQHIIDLKERGARCIVADLHLPSSYRDEFANLDVLFHLASENTTDTSDESRVIYNTFGLTEKVIGTAIDMGVKTIVYTSSVVVLGRSTHPDILISEKDVTSVIESPYVKGKVLSERYCDKVLSEKTVDIRRIYPSWVIGGNDLKLTPPNRLIQDYVEKGQVFYFSGGISITSVEEVAKAHINAWLIGSPGEKYLAGGNNVKFIDFYKALAKYTGHKPPVLFIPKWIMYLGAIVLGKRSPVGAAYVKSVVGSYSWFDSRKAIKELDYKISGLNEIIGNAVQESMRRMICSDLLKEDKQANSPRIEYENDDILLISGFPGWLGRRMLQIMMNGDNTGQYAINRNIRILVEEKYRGLFSLPSYVDVVYGDINDKAVLRQALKGVKAVYHLAGVIYPRDIKMYDRINHQGTKTLVDVCIEEGVRRILYMGTDSICGYGRNQRIFDEHTLTNPYKQYGRSKYLAEKYILDRTSEGLIDGTSIRGFWFFGPLMPARNADFLKMFYWKRQIIFGDGQNFRSVSHVDNIVQAFIKAEKSERTIGKWYWVGNKKADQTVDALYRNIADGMGVELKPLYVPKWICELLSILDSVLCLIGKQNATIHAAGKFHKDIAGDVSAAQRDFNYNPYIGFEEIKSELRQMKLK